MECLTIEQITESSLKDDKEYTLKYFLRCSEWILLRKFNIFLLINMNNKLVKSVKLLLFLVYF